MRPSTKKLISLIFRVGLLLTVCMPLTAQANEANDAAAKNTASTVKSEGNYSSLTSLVNNICNDAIIRFSNFYTPADVTVHPFLTMEDSPNNKSMLGVIIADQMSAMINNETSDRFAAENYPTTTQELTGKIQEIDGYLRINMSGQNELGEKRSYVVAVEMSAPLYRALHKIITP